MVVRYVTMLNAKANVETSRLHLSALANLALLAVTWLVTRSVLLGATLSGVLPGDILAYERWAELLRVGQAPAQDSAFVYPPGSSLIFLGGGVFGDVSYFRSFTILAVAADFVLLLALVLFARRSAEGSMAGPWAWVVLGFAVGPIMLERYDIFAALFGSIAVLTLARPAVTGALAGLGFLVKIWPEIAILGLPRHRMLSALAVNLAVVLGGWLVLQVVFGNSFDFVRNILVKGVSVEAVAAYPFLVVREFFGT